mmetsp:Transcript_10926/g.14455  ORF Transcript_10926/g.14455 Transcript_10926/m.14455 type:complete len:95 (+) Transcript_10926:1120-1404(+)
MPILAKRGDKFHRILASWKKLFAQGDVDVDPAFDFFSLLSLCSILLLFDSEFSSPKLCIRVRKTMFITLINKLSTMFVRLVLVDNNVMFNEPKP